MGFKTRTANGNHESLRRSLLEQLDSLKIEYETIHSILQTLPEELLHRDVGSNWGSIFGILAHATKTQGIICGWLSGNPRGLHTDLEGNFENLDGLLKSTRATSKRMFDLVSNEPDLERVVDYWFPDPGDWYRHRFYQVVQLETHHTCAHRAHAYMIARMNGYELTQNALFYYYRHPAEGAIVIGNDKEIYEDPDVGSRFFPEGTRAKDSKAFKATYDLVDPAKKLIGKFKAATAAVTKKLSKDDSIAGFWNKELKPRLAVAEERLSTRHAEASKAKGNNRNVLMQVGLEEVDERLQHLESYLRGENKDLVALEAHDIEIRRYDSPNLRREFGNRIKWRMTGVPKEVQREGEEVLERIDVILERFAGW